MDRRHTPGSQGTEKLRPAAQNPSFAPLVRRSLFARLLRNRNILLGILGVTGIADLIKEYLRGRLMEWFVSHLGTFGHWLVADSFAFLSMATAICLVVLVLLAVRDSRAQYRGSLIYVPASIHDQHRNRDRRWLLYLITVPVVVLMIVVGVYRYIISLRALSGVLDTVITTALPMRDGLPRTSVITIIRLTNRGEPTTTSNWHLVIHPVDGITVDPGDSIAIPNCVIVPAQGQDEHPFILYGEDDILLKTATVPIPRGGVVVGLLVWHMFARKQDIGDLRTAFLVKFDDAFGIGHLVQFDGSQRPEYRRFSVAGIKSRSLPNGIPGYAPLACPSR